MNLKQLINNVISILQLPNNNRQVEQVIKTHLNEGYMLIQKADPKAQTTYIPIIAGIANLPNNLVELIEISPPLSAEDRVIGKNIRTNAKGTYSILYTYIDAPLVDPEDEPQIADYLHNSLINYALYKMLKLKDINLSEAYHNDFLEVVRDLKDSHNKIKFDKNSISDFYSEFALGSEY